MSTMNLRIFPKPDPQCARVIAVLTELPPRLSDLLRMPEAIGEGMYLSAWIVANGETETEVWLFRCIEDRTAFTRLAHMAASGLKFVQGFETNRLAALQITQAA